MSSCLSPDTEALRVPFVVIEMETASGAVAVCYICPNKGVAVDLAVALLARADHPAGNNPQPIDPGSPLVTLKGHRLNLWQFEETQADGYIYKVIPTNPHPIFEYRRDPDGFLAFGSPLEKLDALLASEDALDARENAAPAPPMSINFHRFEGAVILAGVVMSYLILAMRFGW